MAAQNGPFESIVREVCGRLNASWRSREADDDWFSTDSHMLQSKVNAYLQVRQQQLRDQIWCTDISETEVVVEFHVTPLPADQVALYHASQSSGDVTDLKKFIRGGSGKVYLDPKQWVGRLKDLKWGKLSPCLLWSCKRKYIAECEEQIEPGPWTEEEYNVKCRV